jgi:site-specific recombinase XerD
MARAGQLEPRSAKQRASAPEDIADTLAWLSRNTLQVSDLADPALCRRLVVAATSRLDGTRTAATSVRRNRAVLFNLFEYAVELKLLEKNPVENLKLRVPKTAREVDRTAVVNPAQACALLEAVRAQQPSGPRLVTFFGVLYYSEERTGLSSGCRWLALRRRGPSRGGAGASGGPGSALGRVAPSDG